MATGTYDLDLAEIIEEAFERATGGQRQMTTGYDFKTARRSLNLLTMEWANRGVNLWTLEQGTIPLDQGVGGYQMPSNTIDLIEYAVRTVSGTQQLDLPLTRMSVSTYAAIPNKLQQGRPQQIMMQRLSPNPVLTVWPIPDVSDRYVLVGWRLRRINDASGDSMDIPFRFMPALIAGLAYYMSQKLPEGAQRAQLLKVVADEAFDLASLEDRDKATTRIVPRIARF